MVKLAWPKTFLLLCSLVFILGGASQFRSSVLGSFAIARQLQVPQAAINTPNWSRFSAVSDAEPEAWAVVITWSLQDVAVLSSVDASSRRTTAFEMDAVQYAVSNTLKYFPRGNVGIRLIDTTLNKSLPILDNDELEEVSLMMPKAFFVRASLSVFRTFSK